MSARHPAFAVAVCLTLAVLAAACSAGHALVDAEPAKSGVGIVAEGCGLTAHLASGVVLDHRGQVVTVAHAIAGATSISVVDRAGGRHAAAVLAFDKDRDLAVLAVPDLDAPALKLGHSAPGPGATLTWSRDDGVTYKEATVSKRLLVTIEDIYIDETVKRSALELHGDIGPGDSGGAVLSSTGDVIGIIYARSRTLDQVGFATDSSELQTLLQTMPETPSTNGRCN